MTSRLFTTITGFGSTSDSPYLPDPAGELSSLTEDQREQMNAEAKAAWSEQANKILAPHGLTLIGDGEILQDVDDARPDALRTQLEEDGETLGAWLSEQIELPDGFLDRWISAEQGGEILDRLNSYSGDNIWVDVIRTYDVDEDATERLDPSGASDVFCLDDGREFRFDHQLGSWVEAGF